MDHGFLVFKLDPIPGQVHCAWTFTSDMRVLSYIPEELLMLTQGYVMT